MKIVRSDAFGAGAAAVFGLALGILATPAAAQPEGGAGRYVLIIPDAVGAPKYAPNTRVRGFSLILETWPPAGKQVYDVAAYLEIRPNDDDQWRWCPAKGASVYSAYRSPSTGACIDVMRVDTERHGDLGGKAVVNLFIPHQAIQLSRGVATAEFRFVIRFFEVIRGSARPLPAEYEKREVAPIVLSVRSDSLVRGVYAAVVAAPFMLYDLEQQQFADIRLEDSPLP